MRRNLNGIKKFDSQIEFDDARSARRRTNLLPDGAYLFEDDLTVKGAHDFTVITCAAWLLELFDLKSGEIFFLCGEQEIRPAGRCFGILYPPFSIIRSSFADAKGQIVGFAATEKLPAALTAAPVIFDSAGLAPPANTRRAIEILLAGENRQSIEAHPTASLISVKAKKLIDENYLVHPSIARIAERLKVSHAHLSRQFKLDFKMTPSEYLRRLRLADAPLLLARGKAIIDVSQTIGYNDLSRFYKQFRKTTKTSPGACHTIMKPDRARKN